MKLRSRVGMGVFLGVFFGMFFGMFFGFGSVHADDLTQKEKVKIYNELITACVEHFSSGSYDPNYCAGKNVRFTCERRIVLKGWTGQTISPPDGGAECTPFDTVKNNVNFAVLKACVKKISAASSGDAIPSPTQYCMKNVLTEDDALSAVDKFNCEIIRGHMVCRNMTFATDLVKGCEKGCVVRLSMFNNAYKPGNDQTPAFWVKFVDESKYPSEITITESMVQRDGSLKKIYNVGGSGSGGAGGGAGAGTGAH